MGLICCDMQLDTSDELHEDVCDAMLDLPIFLAISGLVACQIFLTLTLLKLTNLTCEVQTTNLLDR